MAQPIHWEKLRISGRLLFYHNTMYTVLTCREESLSIFAVVSYIICQIIPIDEHDVVDSNYVLLVAERYFYWCCPSPIMYAYMANSPRKWRASPSGVACAS